MTKFLRLKKGPGIVRPDGAPSEQLECRAIGQFPVNLRLDHLKRRGIEGCDVPEAIVLIVPKIKILMPLFRLSVLPDALATTQVVGAPRIDRSSGDASGSLP